MDNQPVFSKVFSDAIKNVIFYGIGALVIAFIGNSLNWRMFALILAGLFGVVILLGAFTAVISFFAGLAAIPIVFQEKKNGNNEALRDQGWLWAGSTVRIIEEVICLGYVVYLYRAFF